MLSVTWLAGKPTQPEEALRMVYDDQSSSSSSFGGGGAMHDVMLPDAPLSVRTIVMLHA